VKVDTALLPKNMVACCSLLFMYVTISNSLTCQFIVDIFWSYLKLLFNMHNDRIASVCLLCGRMLQPTQLFNRSSCLSLRDSKCSKWWNSNFINNLSLLILFILFPSVEIYRSVWCMDALLKTMYSLLALVSRTQLVTSRV